ncbi:hypothetical protein [Streptomyces abikoensis]|uniref:hypothetical protein n=1 Tax=Streptomyces abikoensis TaxID=97398 RepID=UPI0033E511B8
MHRDIAAQWLDVVLATRLFGPGLLRLSRRLIVAGVRVGIDGLGAATAHAAEPLQRRGDGDD